MRVQQDPSQAEERKGVQDPSFDDLLEAVGCRALSLASHSTVFLEGRGRGLACYNKALEGHSPGQWPHQRPKRSKESVKLTSDGDRGKQRGEPPPGLL